MTLPPTPREPLAEADAQVPQPIPHTPHDPYIALRNANFRRYFTGNAFSLLGAQATMYAVLNELYQLTKPPEVLRGVVQPAAILGLVGLVQVVPIIALALPVGHFVDRLNRKSMVLFASSIQVVLMTLLGFSSLFADELFGTFNIGRMALPPQVPIMLALLLVNGACRAINQPAKQSLLPQLVGTEHFSNAITWNAGLFEVSNVCGPLLAGLAIWLLGEDPRHSWAYALVYFANAGGQLVNWMNMWRIDLVHKPRPHEPLTLHSMLAGARFVYRNKIILSAITLDMFAVLLGGATMMLPVFAAQVLFVGPLKQACLRGAASVGSILMALILAHRPPMQNAGRNLLWAVTGFGLAIIVFGLSRSFWVSLVALFFTGFFDNISVVIRHSLVQLQTPDDMRGRVSSVNNVFISASNELGDTESGFTTDIATRFLGTLWGPMIAVAAGGAGTILVVITAALLWPELRGVKRLGAEKPA